MTREQASPRVFMLIPTHTTRHLACCLASLAHQTRSPEGVAVTCDTDDPAIGVLLDEWWPRVRVRSGGRPVLLQTYRPHLGQARLNQVRNNGLRTLRDHFGLRGEDLVVVLDGDTMLAPDALARHAALAEAGFEVIIPYRYMIDEQPTAQVSAEDVLENGVPIPRLATAAQRGLLESRHRRYRRHLLLSRVGLVKSHKPKIIGGHHAVLWRRLVEINGFDEEYIGYRFNDDDLSRRVRAVRPRTAIAVRDIAAFHLWHKVRAPERLEDAPGYTRWSRKDLPTRCVHGIESPLEQPPPVVRVVGKECGRCR
ncbi:MAG: hypothetical protein ACK4WH_08510 [Phycisphaerales bacterium]